MKKQIKVYSGYIRDEKNAGPKARIDVEKVLEKEYNAKIMSLSNSSNRIKSLINKVAFFFNSLFNFNNIVIIQYPVGKHFINSFSKNKILLIHDIDGLRFENSQLLDKEIKYFKSFNYIIAHNKKMEEYLKEKGVTSKIYNFEYWIYLCKNSKNKKINNNKIEIAYAGNISKTSFYNELEEDKMNFILNVYSGEKIKSNKKIIYKGSFEPDELPLKITEPLGLVWDGSLDERDENSLYKNYTKYNNPHKVGCYIAAGIPLIVWEKSAAASLVKKYNIGYTIKSLYDINKLSFKDYEEKVKNINELKDNVIAGKQMIITFDKVFKDIENEES